MNVVLTAAERQQLRTLQKQRRDGEACVKVTVILLLDKRRSRPSIADGLGLDEATAYRYARAFTSLGVDKYLAHERPGSWGPAPGARLLGPGSWGPAPGAC